jgi:GH15 family glucan-1,4-alpha-glucosidase
MPRDIPIGNGNFLIAFDKNYIIRDFYYPFVGMENHSEGLPFRLGFMVGDRFSWVGKDWEISMKYLEYSLVTDVVLANPSLGITARINDLIDFHENIYLKKIKVIYEGDRTKKIKVFFHHDFAIYGSPIGDTAAYKPEVRGLLHYKGQRYFLANVQIDGNTGIDNYATGLKRYPFEGTWKDAEDGVLEGNPIAQGSVDSVAAVHLEMSAGEERTFYYWICAGEKWDDVEKLNSIVVQKSPERILKRTFDYWKLWIDIEELNFSLISPEMADLYRKSLVIIRTQIDNRGGIVAGNDSDTINFHRDTYSYIWMRDAAIISYALDKSESFALTRGFFDFASKVVTKEGYFLHKYTPAGAVGSSWHPWIRDNIGQLPIQEDSTALVLWALWHHFKLAHDIEFIKPLYRSLIIRCCDFLVNFRDEETGLPLPSYDPWEEEQGIHTFTVSAVYAGLIAGANFADSFGEKEIAEKYRRGATEIKKGMDRFLYIENEQRFARKLIMSSSGELIPDLTMDASISGIFAFGVYNPRDPRVASTMEQMYDRLWCRSDIGGLARYEGDRYYGTSPEFPGNPWFVCTLWLAEYHIMRARNKNELEEALKYIKWAVERANPSGVLPEQIDPVTGEPLSVAPLTWSHGMYILVIHEYIDKLVELEKCPVCGQKKYSKKIEGIHVHEINTGMFAH